MGLVSPGRDCRQSVLAPASAHSCRRLRAQFRYNRSGFSKLIELAQVCQDVSRRGSRIGQATWRHDDLVSDTDTDTSLFAAQSLHSPPSARCCEGQTCVAILQRPDRGFYTHLLLGWYEAFESPFARCEGCAAVVRITAAFFQAMRIPQRRT